MADPLDLRRAKRIVIVSRSNGLSGASIGAIAVTLSIVARDLPSILASLGICAAASLELAGSFRAARHEPDAARFLVASQAVSLLSVLALLIRCTIVLNAAMLLASMPVRWRESILIIYSAPGEAEAAVRVGMRFTYGLLAVVAAIFEIGMATFYASSRGLFLRLAAAEMNRP